MTRKLTILLLNQYRMSCIRLICFFGLLQLAGVAISQDGLKRTHLGFSATPQFSLQPLGSSQVEGDKFRFCFSLSGDLYYDLSPALQLKTGLSFLQSKINYRDYSPQFPDDVHNGMALPYKSYWSYDLNQYFIGLPVEAKIKLGKVESVNHFFITGGFRFQYLLHTAVTYYRNWLRVAGWKREVSDQSGI